MSSVFHREIDTCNSIHLDNHEVGLGPVDDIFIDVRHTAAIDDGFTASEPRLPSTNIQNIEKYRPDSSVTNSNTAYHSPDMENVRLDTGDVSNVDCKLDSAESKLGILVLD